MAHRTNITPYDIENKFGFHKATEKTGPLHQELRSNFKEFAKFLNMILPDGQAKSVVFTELETCSMWANKAIAEMAPVVDE